jgi:hypothetical protein
MVRHATASPKSAGTFGRGWSGAPLKARKAFFPRCIGDAGDSSGKRAFSPESVGCAPLGRRTGGCLAQLQNSLLGRVREPGDE